jgi:hypothetical protein
MSAKGKAQTHDLIEVVGKLLADISALGYTPILIGGMAMVTLGSPRVTKDFDFLIAKEAREHNELIKLLYKHRLQLVAKLDKYGNVAGTIDNAMVASARLKIDQPMSAYFYNRDLGLKIDFLFDFPLSAKKVLANAEHKKIRSYTFHIASKKDLIKMKKIAFAERKLSSDQQDLEFLKNNRP